MRGGGDGVGGDDEIVEGIMQGIVQVTGVQNSQVLQTKLSDPSASKTQVGCLEFKKWSWNINATDPALYDSR